MMNLPWTWREEQHILDFSMEILDSLNLAEHSFEEAGALPFGRQRAVELARALAAEPELMLLDEPASGLNIHETEELADRIRNIRDQGRTILLVEHDMSLVMDISDSIVVLNFGEKIAEGPPREIQKNSDVISIYLGDDDA
jgi:branched-chain amino acid transport system ATP-binding protein